MFLPAFLRTLAVGFIVLALLAGGTVYSSETEFKNLSAHDLKQLIDSGNRVLLLNPLPKLMFRQGHIPGSVNIRWHAMEGSRLLPADKETIIVTYCMGAR